MLQLRHVSHRFENGYLALDDIDLEVATGEIVALVGGSGCGKSTLLRILSGLMHPLSGEVWLDGTAHHEPTPDIGIVFQEPRLMPWASIRANVEFGLRSLPAPERRARAEAMLARVGLAHAIDALPRQLSGGMAQRAAIARALAPAPKVLLLDEPFSALDALTRADLQDHVLELWAEHKPTLVLVTHDLDEAIALADRILVMQGAPGRIASEHRVEIGRPRDRTGAPFQSLKRRLLAALHDERAGAGIANAA